MIGITLLRIGLGATMLLGHGLGKLQNFAAIAPHFPDPFGLGGATSLALVVFAEFFCSILLITGTAIRAALIPLIITMLVAVVIIHGGDPFAKKELACVYLLGYLSLLFTGAGCYALRLGQYIPNKPWLSWLCDTQEKKNSCC